MKKEIHMVFLVSFVALLGLFALSFISFSSLDFEITGATVANGNCAPKKLLLLGSGDNYLYALDAVTGELLWKYKTGSTVSGTATIENFD